MKLNEEEIYGSLSDEITAILRGGGTNDEKIAAILSAADKMFDANTNAKQSGMMSGEEAAKHTIHRDDDYGEGQYRDRENNDYGKGIEAGDQDRDLSDIPDYDDEESSDSSDAGMERSGRGKESQSVKGGTNTGDSRDTGGNNPGKGNPGDGATEDFGDVDNMDADEAAEAAQQAADAAKKAADKAQAKANKASADAQAAQQEADQLQQEANEAKSDAEQAQSDSDAAKNSGNQQNAQAAQQEADKMKNAAEQAQDAADAAKQAAQDAANDASAAQQEAEQMRQEAEAAQESANRAQEAADNGDEESARSNAKDAIDSANRNNSMSDDSSSNQPNDQGQQGQDQQNKGQNNKQAQDAADKAQEAAEQAAEQAQQAQDAANQAQDAANKAQEAAEAAEEAADHGGDKDAANQAQDAADKAQDAAEQAQDAANQSKDAAKQAQDAANKAQDAADKGDTKSAEKNAKDAQDSASESKESADKAKDSANDAQDSAHKTADKTRDAAKNADENEAKQAQDKADAADNPKKQNKGNGNSNDNNQQNGQGDSNQDDQDSTPSAPTSDQNVDSMSDFDKGNAFGELLAGLLYGFGGDPDILFSEMHFDEIYELPDIPRLKVKDIHNQNFSESLHESLLLEAEDANILNDLRKALQDANEKRRLARILSVLSRRKNGSPQTPPPPIGGTPAGPPASGMAENGNVDWTKVRIARADGDFDGTGTLFGDNHVMTDEMRSQIEDARSSKLKKTLFDNESPFSSEDGLLKTVEQITGRAFGKDGAAGEEDESRKLVKRIQERVRANRKGYIDWCHELRKFLKGIRMGFSKTDLRTRTIIDQSAPALFNRDRTEEAGNKIVVYLDVSGSVIGRPGVLNQVIAELKKISKECKFKKIDIICFDSGILDQYCLIDQTPSELQNPGWSINTPEGGGTEFAAVYKHMFKYYALKKSTSAVLIFSDDGQLWSSNIFSNWAEKKTNRQAAVYIKKNLGKKCMFIGIGESPSRLPEYKVATIPGTKIVLVSAEEFVNSLDMPEETANESNNTIMNKIYYRINNLSEAFAKTRKKTTPPPAEEPAEKPVAAEEPVASAPAEEPVAADAAEEKDIYTMLDNLEKQDVVADNLNGGEIYEKHIDDWMKAVFGMWKLKKVIGTQNMLAETQTYCVSLVNGLYKININNELSNGKGRKGYGGVYSAQAITIPSKALLPGFMDAGKNIEIASIRGNVKISNFTGDKFPPFFPKRIVGNMDGNGGNLYISNCPNLSSTENFPVFLDGNVVIEGKINISDEDLEAYEEALQEFDAQRRAKAGLPPIEDPEPKVTGNYIN